MERNVSKILALFFIFVFVFVFGMGANAAETVVVKPVAAGSNTTQTIKVQSITTVPQNVSPTVPQSVSFERCTKKYMMPVENLYFFALASINANKFSIDEIQSKSGYILFSAGNRQYLASVNRVDPNSAMLKIVPADNNYFFPIGVVTNFFKYIDMNKNAKIEEFSN